MSSWHPALDAQEPIHHEAHEGHEVWTFIKNFFFVRFVYFVVKIMFVLRRELSG